MTRRSDQAGLSEDSASLVGVATGTPDAASPSDSRRRTHTGPLSSGDRFGRYRIQRLIGKGGYGTVYAAHDPEFSGPVAIKTLSPDLAAKPAQLERFRREAYAARTIDHPNVVRVFDRGIIDRIPYLTMELLQGETLAERIARGPLSIGDMVDLLVPVCDAVERAHQLRIIHRDLKPANIFLARSPALDDRPTPKVLDFGISRMGAAELTIAGALLGTPHYRSPEQVIDSAAIDERTDQYSLGVIMYVCMTGRPPHAGPDHREVFRSIARGDFAAPSMLRSDVPPAVEDVVLRAMKRDPGARFRTVRELVSELRAAVQPRQATVPTSRQLDPSAPAPVARRSEPLPPIASVPSEVRAAMDILGPLLRLRGTSLDVGKALRHAVASIDRIVTGRSEEQRATAIFDTGAALRAFVDAIRLSSRAADKEQMEQAAAADKLLELLMTRRGISRP
jgi:eukaryotic-like serine/threonine-protein kinase